MWIGIISFSRRDTQEWLWFHLPGTRYLCVRTNIPAAHSSSFASPSDLHLKFLLRNLFSRGDEACGSVYSRLLSKTRLVLVLDDCVLPDDPGLTYLAWKHIKTLRTETLRWGFTYMANCVLVDPAIYEMQNCFLRSTTHLSAHIISNSSALILTTSKTTHPYTSLHNGHAC